MGLYVAIPLVLFIIVLLWIVPVGLWLQAIFSIGGGHVTIFNLVGMRFRRVPPSVIVNGLIAAKKSWFRSSNHFRSRSPLYGWRECRQSC